jgi:hypothetical protein
VHLLPTARRDHVLEDAKLLVHLGPSPSLDQAVRCLSGDLAPSRAAIARLLPLGAISGGRSGSFAILCLGLRILSIFWLHLNDLARPCGWWRQRVVVLGDDAGCST